MKPIKGHAVNISANIVGQVFRKRHLFSFTSGNDPAIFAIKENTHPFSPVLAFISAAPISEAIKGQSLSFIENIPHDCFTQLKEGDVVLATPEGHLKILYDTVSSHNCLFATGRCDLKCIMCPQPPTGEPDPLIDDQINAIKLMAKHEPKRMAITGGEPTLLGPDLIKLISACKKYMPNTPLAILSNGKRFKDFTFVKKIVAVRHSALQFEIPLYSDDYFEHDKIVGVEGSFFETVKGLQNLALFGQDIEIRTVTLPQNAHRFRQLAEFIYRNLTFVRHVAFMGMEVIGNARKNADNLWQDPISYVDDLEKAIRYLHRADIAVSIYNFQLCILPEKLWRFSRKSISDWKNCYIDECDGCSKKDLCGGFFSTSGEYRSKSIFRI